MSNYPGEENGEPYSHLTYTRPGGIKYLIRDAGATIGLLGIFNTGFDILVEQTVTAKDLAALAIGTVLYKLGSNQITESQAEKEL